MVRFLSRQAVLAISIALLASALARTMGGLWWSPDVISGSVFFAGLMGLFVNAIASDGRTEAAAR